MTQGLGRFAGIAACLVALVARAEAQAVFIPQPKPLTAEQQVAFDAIRDTRDSVVAVSALLAGLQRDLKQKPASSLEQEASLIAEQCRVAERQRAASRSALAAQRFSELSMAEGQRRMLSSMDRLKQPLASCGKTYGPLGAAGKGEEVRGYGVSRSRSIVAGLNEFEKTVLKSAKELQLPVRDVVRAGAGPVSGSLDG